MAWIGLRTNKGSTGTGLADTLSKALLGDPTDVMNAAKTRSALETDEYQRRLLREQIGEQQINALKLGQERLREHDIYMKGREAGEQMRAYQTSLEEQRRAAATTAELPVPVPDIELVSGGGGGVPEHLRNFDERHQPIALELPVPVVEEPALRLPAGMPSETYLPSATPMPVPPELFPGKGPRLGEPALTADRLGSPDLPEDRLGMAQPLPSGDPRFGGPPLAIPQVAGPVRPDETSPLEGRSRIGMALRALLGQGSPQPDLGSRSRLPEEVTELLNRNNMLGSDQVASFAPEAPLPVDTYLPSDEPLPLLAGDPRLADTPIDQVGESKLGAPATALLEGDPRLNYDQPVPVEMLQPQPPPPDTMPTAAVEPPVPVETAPPASVPAVAATAPPSPPPSAAPSPAPVDAPDKTRITIKGSDGKPADAAGNIQTKGGPLPSQMVSAAYDAIWMGPGTYDDKMQATLRLNGMLDIDNDPRVGIGEGKDENATLKTYTKLQGGTVPGRESMIGGNEAIRVAKATGKEPDHFGPIVTGDQAKALGLDPTKSYQQNTKTEKWDPIGGSGVSVTVGGEGETEFAKNIGKKQAEVITGLYDDALVAGEDEVSLSELEEQLKTAPTGAGANIVIWANRFGIKLAEGADDLTAANAIISKLVPKQREEGSGTLSDKDVALFRESMPNILNQPGGNAKIMKYLKGLVEYRKARGALASRVMSGTLSRDDFLVEVNKLTNPLADLSSDTAETAPATTAVPTVKTDADFDALPSGTVFTGPDGKRRTKP